MIQSFGKTVAGRRPDNQDTIGEYPDLGLFVVADGLGGYAGGKTASKLAVGAVHDYFVSLAQRDPRLFDSGEEVSEDLVKHHLTLCVDAAQNAVVREAHGDLSNMGTTLVIVWLVATRAGIAHVGDSRAYRLRDGIMQPLTRDHSLLAEMRSTATESVGRLLFGRSFSAAVTRSLGRSSVSIPDIRVERLEPNDRFLLCSDGLLDGLTDAEIEAITRNEFSSERHAEELIHAAHECGSRDNISVVVAQWG